MAEDIVLVTIDSLRADHCGWHDGGAELTPFLDELAAESLTYTAAIAPGPRTFSSVPVTLTGDPLAAAPGPITGDDDRIARMKAHMTSHTALAERVRDEGYTTVAFTANPWTSADVAFDRGFDRFTEVGREGGEIHDLLGDTPLGEPARLFDHWLHKDRWFSQWRTFYDDIVATVEGIDGPVFAWVFLLDTHNPYLVPRADRYESSTLGMYAALYRANELLGQADGKSGLGTEIDDRTLDRLRAAYRDSVRSVDTFVERLVTDLGDPVVVFHSDHGEAFGEHGTFGHQSAVYEENIHVPLLVHGVGEGTVTDPVSLRSVPELVLPAARRGSVDPDAVTTDYAVARTLDDSAVGLRGRRWKYVRTADGDRLFDLVEDPGETTDVAERHPDVLADLRERCDDVLESLPAENPADADPGDTREMKAHLRSLGYVGE